MPAGYDKLNGICFEAVIGNIVCICIQITVSKLAIGIPSTNQQIHTDRPPLNCRDLLQKTA